MSELKMASGNTKGAQLGACVSIKERDKIASLVEDPLSHGAHIKTGGRTPEGRGAFYLATVLTINKDNPILKELAL